MWKLFKPLEPPAKKLDPKPIWATNIYVWIGLDETRRRDKISFIVRFFEEGEKRWIESVANGYFRSIKEVPLQYSTLIEPWIRGWVDLESTQKSIADYTLQFNEKPKKKKAKT